MSRRFPTITATLTTCALLGATGCPQDDLPSQPDAGAPPLPSLRFEDPDAGSGPADLSCLGERTQPVAGDERSFTMAVVPFGAPPSVRVPGAVVHIFAGNEVPDDDICAAPDCVELVADEQGEVTVEVPAEAWFAYRVLPMDGDEPTSTFLRTVESHLSPPEEGGRVENLNTITAATLNGLAASVGGEVRAATGVVSGRLRDCQGRPLAGAVMRIFDEDGVEIELGPKVDDAQVYYFDGAVPPALDATGEYTSIDGRFAAVNMPPSGLARIELWGVPEGEAEPVLVACEELGIHADTLSVIALLPTRSDGPTRCGEVPLSISP
ncbi:hypothetical protein [Haliangium sp.]|uniref:hypothetical protein n=1 Tax=Haliangium sp. TaxID=2663208 RepID=UPI003D0FF351